MGKFFWSSVANIDLGKLTKVFQKIPSSFGVMVRKPGERDLLVNSGSKLKAGSRWS